MSVQAKTMLRLPVDLHAELKQAAEDSSRSMNDFVVHAIREQIRHEKARAHLMALAEKAIKRQLKQEAPL